RSAAGRAPDALQNHEDRDARPVRCSVGLSRIADQPQLATLEVAQPNVYAVGARAFDDVVVFAQSLHHDGAVTDRRWTLVHLPAVVMLRRVEQLDNLDLRILG